MRVPRAVVRTPGRVIAQAKRTGMVALLEMLKRGELEYPGIYRRSLRIWRASWSESQKLKEKGDLDYFIPICKVEGHLRKNQHDMIFNTTATIGNRETKRVYSFEEGTIGLLNQTLSSAGSRLKFLGMTRYFFPTPSKISYEYTLKNGHIKAESGYGYLGSRKSIKVIITHPTLPSLDFVDMIRAPLLELCRECFRNSVQGLTAIPYLEEMLLRLRPYLDHIYTRRRTGSGLKVGTNNFVERADSILDKIVHKIQANHGTRSPSISRITADTGNSEQYTTGFYSLQDIRFDASHQQIRTTLADLLSRNIIKPADFDRLAKKILTLAASRGTQIHRRLSWGLVSPPSDVASILGGDYYSRSLEGYLLNSEVPVWSGKGKADLVLSVRKSMAVEIEDEYQAQADWQPVFVVDTKTKSGIDCGFIGRVLDDGSSVVIDEACRKRLLSNQEWTQILSNTPSSAESSQLKYYESGLAECYQRTASDISESIPSIIRGILVLDEADSIAKIRDNLEGFAISAYEKFRDIALDLIKKNEASIDTGDIIIPKYIFEIKPRYGKRCALVTEPFSIPRGRKLGEVLPLPSKLSFLHTNNPFANRIIDSRKFILYVSAPAQGAGRIASWIARYWHGFDLIYKTAIEGRYKNITWLDLGGEFSDSQLRQSFLRRYAIGSYQSKEEGPRPQIRNLVDRIEFCNLHDTILSALIEGGRLPSISDIETITKDFDLVIVSGMDTLRKAVSSKDIGLIQILEASLAEGSKASSLTIWFDTMVSTPDSSRVYKQKRAYPFSYDSPLQIYVDEIIINHHMPPNSGISESPISDEVRYIVKITPSSYEKPEIVFVPPLRGWHARFRVDSKPNRRAAFYQKMTSSSKRQYQSFEFSEDELLDFLTPIKLANGTSLNVPNPDESGISRVPIIMRESHPRFKGYKGVLSRSNICPDLCDPVIRESISKRKGEKWKALTSINTRRKNWTRRLHLEVSKITHTPPDESHLFFSKLLLNHASKLEIDRILEVVSLLGNMKTKYHQPTKDFLAKLVLQINKLQLEAGSDSRIVDGLMKFLRMHNYTKSIWYALSYERSNLLNWSMSLKIRTILQNLQQTHPDLMLRFGSYFIILLSFLQETTSNQMALSCLCDLWNSLQPWVLMQLGARQHDSDLPQSVYTTKGVFLALKRRWAYLESVPASSIPPFKNIRYGLQLDSEPDWDDDTQMRFQYRWYVFEKAPFSKDLVAGCYDLGSKGNESLAIIPLDEQAEAVSSCSPSPLITPLLIAELEGITILYCADEEPYSSMDIDYSRILWKPLGQLRYGTRGNGALARLKWISTSYFGQFPIPKVEYLPKRPASAIQGMFEYPSRIYDKLLDAERTKCRISGDDKKGVIEFLDKSKRSIGTIAYASMNNAVRILRTPYDAGLPLAFGRKYLTWNPISDIIYSDNLQHLRIEVENGLV